MCRYSFYFWKMKTINWSSSWRRRMRWFLGCGKRTKTCARKSSPALQNDSNRSINCKKRTLMIPLSRGAPNNPTCSAITGKFRKPITISHSKFISLIASFSTALRKWQSRRFSFITTTAWRTFRSARIVKCLFRRQKWWSILRRREVRLIRRRLRRMMEILMHSKRCSSTVLIFWALETVVIRIIAFYILLSSPTICCY